MKDWTPDELKYLATHNMDGFKTIAKELNRTSGSVKLAYRRYHIARDTSNKKKDPKYRSEVKCWACKHATNKYGKCSWSMNGTPRDDWKINRHEDGTFDILDCPGYGVGRG